MWGAQGNELSDTAPGPWVILLTITQDSPSFIAHARRLLRVCNNYLGLAVRSLVPAQRGWCSVSLHSRLGPALPCLASCDSWWKITPLILRGGSPPLHQGPKRGLVLVMQIHQQQYKTNCGSWGASSPWSDDGSVVGFKTAKTWAREFYLWSIHF